jgi:hypothetical protein
LGYWLNGLTSTITGEIGLAGSSDSRNCLPENHGKTLNLLVDFVKKVH